MPTVLAMHLFSAKLDYAWLKQGVKFLYFPIFSYFSQHTPIFPIFQQFPPIFPIFSHFTYNLLFFIIFYLFYLLYMAYGG